jgi:hypothetical protein
VRAGPRAALLARRQDTCESYGQIDGLEGLLSDLVSKELMLIVAASSRRSIVFTDADVSELGFDLFYGWQAVPQVFGQIFHYVGLPFGHADRFD